MRWLLLPLAALAILIWSPPASANPLCHSVLTTDTTLTGNLDCSGLAGDPVILWADGITFRLNGFTLTGPPGFVNSGGELDVECVIASGRTGVRVLGPGTIKGCGRAVSFQGGSGNEAADLHITDNLTGIVFQGGSGHVAHDNIIKDNLGTGVALSEVVGAQILDNLIQDNGGDADPDRGFGITNDNFSTATIGGNRILRNLRGGIKEVGASTFVATIVGNVVLDNGGFDLDLRGTDDTVTDTVCRTSRPDGLCAVSSVPEPSTPSLLAAGLLVLAFVAGRRERNTHSPSGLPISPAP